MDFDRRFELIDAKGIRYPAAILDGCFQVGKDREATPSSLAEFARAILHQGKTGRFQTPSGQKSIMGFGGKSRKAVAYKLDPTIADLIGVQPQGSQP